MADTILAQQMLKQRRLENEKHLSQLKKKHAKLDDFVREIDQEVSESKNSRDEAIKRLRSAKQTLFETTEHIEEIHDAVLQV